MPSFEEILQYMNGAWRMMTGRNDGLRMLDISADGFWNSFFAIVVALPPLLLSWVAFTSTYLPDSGAGAARLPALLLLAFVDLSGWVVPLILFAAAAKPAGISDRFATYVVATNWGSAVTSWIAIPPALIRLLVPGSEKLSANIGLIVFLVTLALFWRLTNAALDKGPIIATAVFAAMATLSITIMVTLQSYFGLVPA